MAEKFNFHDAYETDSCDEDSWEGICRHVGLSYGESGDEHDMGDAGSKDRQEGTDLTVEETDETVEPTDKAVELWNDLKQLRRITKLQ